MEFIGQLALGIGGSSFVLGMVKVVFVQLLSRMTVMNGTFPEPPVLSHEHGPSNLLAGKLLGVFG